VFNVPRPPGLSRAVYVADLDAAVSRAIEGWKPGLILISAGFDALAGDPLAGFTLEPEDYGTWVTSWRRLRVPIATVLEGGYDPERTARAAAAHLAALA
jgi:acetoin utilization deacetylase AcuC-like enzyme